MSIVERSCAPRVLASRRTGSLVGGLDGQDGTVGPRSRRCSTPDGGRYAVFPARPIEDLNPDRDGAREPYVVRQVRTPRPPTRTSAHRKALPGAGYPRFAAQRVTGTLAVAVCARAPGRVRCRPSCCGCPKRPSRRTGATPSTFGDLMAARRPHNTSSTAATATFDDLGVPAPL